jgi:hypothetical protein
MSSLSRLSHAVRAAGISSPAQFQALALRLSPQQARLFQLLLEDGPCNTVTVRQRASVGNISECASALNAKLQAAGDARRVRCELRPHENKFGERGVLGWWRLADAEQAAA